MESKHNYFVSVLAVSPQAAGCKMLKLAGAAMWALKHNCPQALICPLCISWVVWALHWHMYYVLSSATYFRPHNDEGIVNLCETASGKITDELLHQRHKCQWTNWRFVTLIVKEIAKLQDQSFFHSITHAPGKFGGWFIFTNQCKSLCLEESFRRAVWCDTGRFSKETMICFSAADCSTRLPRNIISLQQRIIGQEYCSEVTCRGGSLHMHLFTSSLYTLRLYVFTNVSST